MTTKKRTLRPKTKKKTIGVAIDFPTTQYRKLKAAAALRGITLQDYIRSQVVAEPESSDVSDEELKPIMEEIIKEYEDALRRLANK